MTRQPYAIAIDITEEAPYLVHGNDAGRFGLDATLLRDHAGRPILPGTLVAGRIVEAWHNLGPALGNADVEEWFGRSQDRRARIHVDDLVLQGIDGTPWTPDTETKEVSRIRQNDDTGAVETGALLIVEQVAAPGAKLVFTGTWRAWADDDEIRRLLPQLRAALLLQTQLGAYRGVGFGRLKGIDVSANVVNGKPLSLDAGALRHRLALRTDRPFCVGSRSRRGNVFESDDILSGGTLLGALATLLAARHGTAGLDGLDTPLARHFSLLRCTHALPTQAGGARPLPLPQSLVSLGHEIKDAWQHAAPPTNLAQAPAFQTDWKGEDFDKAKLNQGWGGTRRHLRVRTDIDGNGQAKESSLFAYECVTPAVNEKGETQTEWLFDLDLSAVPEDDRAAATQELAALLGQGLFPIGKTDAVFNVTVGNAGAVWSEANLDAIKQGDRIPLLLASDALLFATDAVADQPKPDLKALYAAAFADLAEQAGCQGALTLGHFFATQRLAGGDYLWRQFQKTDTYQPWVLTEAGSVFVFEVKEAEAARKVLRHWSVNGLGLPQAVTPQGGATWCNLPYLPSNGYGEVAIRPKHGFADL